MSLQTPQSASLRLLFTLLLFLLGANGASEGPTSCDFQGFPLRIKEGTTGVIMKPPAAHINLTLRSQPGPGITYNATTKELIANKPIQSGQSYYIEFWCLTANKRKELVVSIIVLEVNNLNPVWKIDAVLKNSTTVTFEENKEGAILTASSKILCDGRDGNSDNETLRIIKSAFSDHFQITGSGNILKLEVVKGLDYEKSNRILQTIRCEDRNETGFLVGTADFELTVLVTNLQEKGRYTFNHTVYSAAITLDKVAPGRTLTLTPGALDATNSLADQPVEPKFSIESITNRPADNGLFEISSKTGVISIAKNYSEPRLFEVRVRVIVLNDNSPSNVADYATVRVEFKVPPGLKLQFEPASIRPITVPEKTSQQSLLRIVRVKYAFVTYLPQNVKFKVETHNKTFYFTDSSLKLLRLLDFEKGDKAFSVRIKASDNNTASITTVLNVTVTDANDSRPKFNRGNYQFKVKIKTQKNSFVGRVLASDMDTNSVLTFSLIGPDSNAFKINRTTGDIFLIVDWRELNQTSYSFTVRVYDGVNEGLTVVKVKVDGKEGGNISRANTSTVVVAALGTTVFLIILVSLVGFCWFKRHAEARRKKQMDSRQPGDSLYYSETGMTALQENPVYTNDLEDGGIDMGIFKGDRDVSEMELYDSGDVVAPRSHGGTLHTGMSQTLSSFQHGAPRMQNGHSIRLSNNMELVSADNAVYSEAMDEVTTQPKDELTIYY